MAASPFPHFLRRATDVRVGGADVVRVRSGTLVARPSGLSRSGQDHEHKGEQRNGRNDDGEGSPSQLPVPLGSLVPFTKAYASIRKPASGDADLTGRLRRLDDGDPLPHPRYESSRSGRALPSRPRRGTSVSMT